MKNILVPVDFSDASFNAVSYAAFLSNAFGARLTLVHAYTGTSALAGSAGAIIYTSQKELEVANEKYLNSEIERIARKFTVEIEGIVVNGKPENVINEVVTKIRPCMIVMGMKGKGESNSRFGSTTTSMISKTLIPLLIIPKNSAYQTIDTITLALDFKDKKRLANFKIIEQLIEKFDPFIEILNVQKKGSRQTIEMVVEKMNKDLTWDKYNHSFNIIERDDVEEGINRFLSKHPSDLLVMVARKRNLITRSFELSHTKKMTGQIKVPLLVLHD